MPEQKKMTWCGRPIEELTKEELMDALVATQEQLNDTHDGWHAVEEMRAHVRDMKGRL